jgi:hypothetical protein
VVRSALAVGVTIVGWGRTLDKDAALMRRVSVHAPVWDVKWSD